MGIRDKLANLIGGQDHKKKSYERHEKIFANFPARSEIVDRITGIVDIRAGEQRHPASRCGSYTFFLDQLYSIRERYLINTLFGSSITKQIIDTRVGFIAGNGVNASVDENFKEEAEWLSNFIQENKLHSYGLTDILKYSELEGKCLMKLKTHEGNPSYKSLVEIIPISYYERLYVFDSAANIEKPITKVHVTNYSLGFYNSKGQSVVPTSLKDFREWSTTWSSKLKSATYKIDEFVFMQMHGIKSGLYVTPPPMAYCLYEAEAIDRAKDDWRGSNHYYATPKPAFEAANPTDLAQTMDGLADSNKTINMENNQMWWGVGKFYYVSPPSGHFETFDKEMVRNVQHVSGVSKIPPFLFGFPDVFGTKAGIEEISALVYQGTQTEREIVVDKMREVIQKSASLYNKKTNSNLNMDSLVVTLPGTTHQQIKSLVETWIPLMDSGVVSRRGVMERVPGIDPQEEEEKIQEEKESNMQNFMSNIGEEDEV